MAENRIYLRLSEGKREQLVDWADQQGRQLTNLASWLVERSIDEAIKTGEYKPTVRQEKQDTPEAFERLTRAQKFIQAILRHESIDGLALAQLASDLETDPKDLHNLLKKHGGKVTNGS